MDKKKLYAAISDMTKRFFKGLLAISLIILIMAPSCKEAAVETDPNDTSVPQSRLFSGPLAEGTLESTVIDEASGIAASRSNSLYLWTHNDSGGDADLYLFTTAGADSGRYTLEGAGNIDWEDMTVGPGPDDALNYLFVADMGDNAAVRGSYFIYRVAEPDLNVADLPTSSSLSGVDRINFVYSDGVARDAESLMVDPNTKDLYIVSKREAQVGVYRLPYPQDLTATDTAVFQGVIPFTNIVAADISPDGSEILMKDYFNVYHFPLTAEGIQGSMLAPPSRLIYTAEPQGEAIAWSADGNTYYTLSEIGRSTDPVVLYSYRRN